MKYLIDNNIFWKSGKATMFGLKSSIFINTKNEKILSTDSRLVKDFIIKISQSCRTKWITDDYIGFASLFEWLHYVFLININKFSRVHYYKIKQ